MPQEGRKSEQKSDQESTLIAGTIAASGTIVASATTPQTDPKLTTERRSSSYKKLAKIVDVTDKEAQRLSNPPKKTRKTRSKRWKKRL